MAKMRDMLEDLKGKRMWIREKMTGGLHIIFPKADYFHAEINEVGEDYFVVNFPGKTPGEKVLPKIYAVSAVTIVDFDEIMKKG